MARRCASVGRLKWTTIAQSRRAGGREAPGGDRRRRSKRAVEAHIFAWPSACSLILIILTLSWSPRRSQQATNMTRLAIIPRQTPELLSAFARLGLAGSPKAIRAAPIAGPSSRPSCSTPPSTRRFTTSSPRRLATEAAEPTVQALAADESAFTAAPPATWTSQSRRVGLIARKRGMVTYFLPTGQAIPCTVLQIDDCQVSAHIGFPPTKPHPTHDAKGQPIKIPKLAPYTALQIAAGEVTSRIGIGKSVKGHLAKAGIKTKKRVLKEFKITKDALLPLGKYSQVLSRGCESTRSRSSFCTFLSHSSGTTLSAAHFVPGQDVDVSCTARGKGFQGAMKRHGFHGLRASHGVSISHRSHGSTGQNSDPSRVWPGQKMAGRMGGKRATVHNLKVLRVDLDRELILVKGPLPGPDGGVVEVTDARRSLIWKAAKKNKKQGLEGAEALPEGIDALPFPAGTREMKAGLPSIIEWTGASATAA